MRHYTVILEYDPDVEAYAVTVPALPGCTSQGATIDEALANAKDAIAGHVASLEQLGEPVPDEIAGTIIVTNVAA